MTQVFKKKGVEATFLRRGEGTVKVSFLSLIFRKISKDK